MARIFISYRRQDSAYPAGILRDALQARFGTESVFFDLDNIPFGVDFRQYIANAVGQCDVLLVMIGDQWLQLTDNQGRRRIEDVSDFVRIEIESGLKRDIPVVPVLVEEAKMPGASELPESIRDLAFRNAAEIGRGRDQKHQIERLVSDLERFWPAKVSDGEEEKLETTSGIYDGAAKQLLKSVGLAECGDKTLNIEDYYRPGDTLFELRWPLDVTLPMAFNKLDHKTQFFVLFQEWTRRALQGDYLLYQGDLQVSQVIFKECLARAQQLGVAELIARSYERLAAVAERKGLRAKERNLKAALTAREKT